MSTKMQKKSTKTQKDKFNLLNCSKYVYYNKYWSLRYSYMENDNVNTCNGFGEISLNLAYVTIMLPF